MYYKCIQMYFWSHTWVHIPHSWLLYIGPEYAEATITVGCQCVCVCAWNHVSLYIQTRYTSANQQAIEVNGHHDFAANRHVVGYRFRWGWGTSMPSKNARKRVWKGFNFKGDYRHHIYSHYKWQRLQLTSSPNVWDVCVWEILPQKAFDSNSHRKGGSNDIKWCKSRDMTCSRMNGKEDHRYSPMTRISRVLLPPSNSM